MKKILFVFLMSICMAPAIFSQPANTDEKTPLNIQTPSFNLFFLQTASAGILKKVSDDSNQFYLTLYGVNPYITYFSERPERIDGLVPFQNFINAWPVGANNYNVNPPNAIITASKINSTDNKGGQYYLVTLSEPLFDIQKMTARYTVTPIGSQKILISETKLDYVTVFID